MGRLVMQLFIELLFALALLYSGQHETYQISRHSDAEGPYIAPWLPVAAVVWQYHIFRQRDAAAYEWQEHYYRFRGFLDGGLFLFLQFLQLAAGQAGKQGGIRVLLFFSLIIVKHTNNLFHPIVSISIIFTVAI